MPTPKILFVDDEESLLIGLQRLLRREFAIETALSPEQGLTALESGDTFAVVVVDMKMPRMDGIAFLRRARETAPEAVRIMLTGNADQQTAVDAVNEGAVFRFLTKPCSPEHLKLALHAALRHYELGRAERELLDQTLRAALAVLCDLLALSEPATFGAAQRLRELVRQLGTHLRQPHLWDLEIAASLARLGQLTLPPTVLLSLESGAHLDPAERALVAKVPLFGSQLLGRVPRLERVSTSILYQQKNFDGTGFPDNIVAGLAIPFGGRMLRLLIDLEELEQRGLTATEALHEMARRVGRYDPDLFVAARECFGRHAPATPPGGAIPVPLAQLRAGQRLAADLASNDGLLILPRGQTLTGADLQRLHNFASLGNILDPVFVLPGEPGAAVPDSTGEVASGKVAAAREADPGSSPQRATEPPRSPAAVSNLPDL